MIETRQKMIDGNCYTVTQLPARRALKIKARLIKTFGCVFAKLLSQGQNPDSLSDAIQIFSSSVDENIFEAIITELLSTARKNGIELNASTIDLEFAGDLAAIYKVVAFVIEVNYENFFTMCGITNLFDNYPQPPQNAPKESVKDYTRN